MSSNSLVSFQDWPRDLYSSHNLLFYPIIPRPFSCAASRSRDSNRNLSVLRNKSITHVQAHLVHPRAGPRPI